MLYAVLAIVTAVVAFLIVWPLRRAHSGADAEEGHLAIYREEAARLDRQEQNGEISPAQAKAAREELERRVLAAAQTGERGSKPGALPANVTALLVIGILIVAGGGLYALMGNPDVPARPAEGRLDFDLQQANLTQLLERLQAELKKDPDQLEGWLLLARTARNTNRAYLARHAYENALRLAPQDPEIRLEYADLLAAMEPAGKPAPSEALDIYEELWAAHPGSPQIAMGLLSLYERNGKTDEAVAVLEDLRGRFPEGSPMRARMEEQLDRLRPPTGADRSPIDP